MTSVRWRTADRGAATVLACAALAALIGLTVLISQIGLVVVARHRVQAAADLAALAAAGALAQGAGAGCAAAAEIAGRMRGQISQCQVVGWDVTVEVAVNVQMRLIGDRMVRARARAGPITGDG